MSENALIPWTNFMDFMQDAALGGLVFISLFLLYAWIVGKITDKKETRP